jgi:hypothetical protein
MKLYNILILALLLILSCKSSKIDITNLEYYYIIGDSHDKFNVNLVLAKSYLKFYFCTIHLKGRVLANDEALSGVVILLKHKTTLNDTLEITDSTGTFDLKINIKKGDIICFNLIGYQNLCYDISKYIYK